MKDATKLKDAYVAGVVESLGADAMSEAAAVQNANLAGKLGMEIGGELARDVYNQHPLKYAKPQNYNRTPRQADDDFSDIDKGPLLNRGQGIDRPPRMTREESDRMNRERLLQERQPSPYYQKPSPSGYDDGFYERQTDRHLDHMRELRGTMRDQQMQHQLNMLQQQMIFNQDMQHRRHIQRQMDDIYYGR